MLELKACNSDLLDDLDYVKDSMVRAADEVGAHIIGESFHRFHPRGVTGILAIAESHICIHTWPEYGYAAADIFTCSTTSEPKRAAQILIDRLESKEASLTELKRGVISQPVASS
jgi:S-adenosylmethionine decarboxylase proenzyme